MPEPALADEADDSEEESADEQNEETNEVDEEETVEEETQEETQEEEEEEPVEEADLPEDVDEDVSTGESSGSLLGGTTFGVSNTVLLGIGITALLIVLIMASQSSRGASQSRYEDKDDVDEAKESASETMGQPNPMDAGGGRESFSEESQEAAINDVFGGSQ